MPSRHWSRISKHSLTAAGYGLCGYGVPRMDMMSMVTSLLAAQAGNVQTQIATSILKSNADAEKFAVRTLLGGQTAPSSANLGSGIGGRLNITA
jgi:hypothetical protein